MTAPQLLRALNLLCSVLGNVTSLRADANQQSPAPDQLDSSEKQIRPLIERPCYQCHYANAKRVEATLLLHGRTGHDRGDDSGPAIVSGDADPSTQKRACGSKPFAISRMRCPRRASCLTTILARWGKMGAPWTDEPAPTADADRKAFDLEQRKAQFEIWQPIANGDSPEVKDEAGCGMPLTDTCSVVAKGPDGQRLMILLAVNLVASNGQH